MTATDAIGAAGEAVVEARILRQGLAVARPRPDRGVDLLAVAPDMTRAVPVQVKTFSRPSIEVEKGWFRPVDVVLAVVWMRDAGEEVFLFDGLIGVERFLGASAQTASWQQGGRYAISDMSAPSQRARIAPFAEDWAILHRRLGLPLPAAPADATPYRLTRHARERVEAGEVQEAWIAETLAEPDRQGPDPRRPGITLSWRRIAAFGDRHLRVAHRDDNGHIIVITAFFDRGASS